MKVCPLLHTNKQYSRCFSACRFFIRFAQCVFSVWLLRFSLRFTGNSNLGKCAVDCSNNKSNTGTATSTSTSTTARNGINVYPWRQRQRQDQVEHAGPARNWRAVWTREAGRGKRRWGRKAGNMEACPKKKKTTVATTTKRTHHQSDDLQVKRQILVRSANTWEYYIEINVCSTWRSESFIVIVSRSICRHLRPKTYVYMYRYIYADMWKSKFTCQ